MAAGGSLVAEGDDDDGPLVILSHSSGSMGRLAPALLGLPFGGYFFGPRALHFRLSGFVATSVPLGSRFPVALPLLVRWVCPPVAPWQLTVAPRVSL